MHYIRGRFRKEKRGTKEIYQSSLMAPARLERAPPDTTFTVYCLKDGVPENSSRMLQAASSGTWREFEFSTRKRLRWICGFLYSIPVFGPLILNCRLQALGATCRGRKKLKFSALWLVPDSNGLPQSKNGSTSSYWLKEWPSTEPIFTGVSVHLARDTAQLIQIIGMKNTNFG
ncbi:hypothetical protein B0H13DRAFT_1896773 [Mycena leptocephala]|nr:hypothetical protein B0H13DRAFT_1896773 [Mycena leptocephala]